jgi:hypothetical protein
MPATHTLIFSPIGGRVSTVNIRRGMIVKLSRKPGEWMVLKRQWSGSTDDLWVTPYEGKITARGRGGQQGGQKITDGIRRVTHVATARA